MIEFPDTPELPEDAYYMRDGQYMAHCVSILVVVMTIISIVVYVRYI